MSSRDDEGEASTVAATVVDSGSHSPTSVDDLRAGSMIGRYQLVSRLGAGAMGIVWSAMDPQLDRKVAIKLVHPRLARTVEASARLMREARAMAKLSHRSVVTVHDSGDVDGHLFLAMELVQGTNLGAILRARDASAIADWRRWLALMIDAGLGLAAAHEAGVLHRDFKPDNVLVDDSGRVCVGDFGLASLGVVTPPALSERSTDVAVDLTTTGMLLGTPAYMSPQQLHGEPVDARADQFSFCVACWEALYGTRPFTVVQRGFDALPALIEEIEKGVLPDPPPGSQVPGAVREVIARGLAADPESRWPDMTSLVAALRHAGGLDRQRMPTAIERHPRRIAYVIAAGALALAATTAVLALRHGAKTDPSRPRITGKRLFAASVNSRIAISSDGKRLALSSDRLEVRDLEGSGPWSAPLRPGDTVTYLEVDANSVRFSRRNSHKLERWAYAGDGTITTELSDLGGDWLAHVAGGDLVLQSGGNLVLFRQGREAKRWRIENSFLGLATSVDRRRIAYVDSDRFMGYVVVRDLETDRVVRSEPIVSPTAVAWRDNTTLIYGSGTLAQPRIFQVTVGEHGFSTPVEIYSVEAGWFGQLAARGDRIYALELHPAPRARLVDRTASPSSIQDFDTESVGLGWAASGESLMWSRSTERIERRGSSVALTKAGFDAEPASATTSGDIVIAAIRRPAGREVIAQSLVDGTVLWHHADEKTLVVRCAGDLHPPCFAVRTGDLEQIVTLDPNTGALGSRPIYTGKLEDIAVNEQGTRLLIAGKSKTVAEIDASGAPTGAYDTPLTSVRSVAYDPAGGILFAGSLAFKNYLVGGLRDGVPSVFVQADDDILSLVRPSPDGTRIEVLARAYSPELWELVDNRH